MSAVPGPLVSIVFQYVTTSTDDGMGNRQPTWATKITVSGGVEEVSGDEAIVGDQDTVIATHRLYISYTAAVISAGIDAKMRAVFASKTCEVLWVTNPGRMNVHLEIMVREIDS